MKAWPIVSLEELASDEPNSVVDGPFGSDLKKSEYVEAGIPLIRIQNVKPNRFLSKEIRYISDQKAKQLWRHDYQPGDLVITKLGDPCGVACIVPEEAGNGVIVADIVRFRGDPHIIHHGFLSHFINSPTAAGWIDRQAKGTTRQRVNLSNFKRLPVPVPPLPEQRRIAEILDRAEALKAKRRDALTQLDILTQAIFLDFFGDPNTNPKRWRLLRLQEVLSIPLRNGLSPSHTGKVTAKVLTLSAITGSCFDASALKASTFQSAPPSNQTVDEADFLICRGNGNLHLVGKGYFPTRSMSSVTFPDTMIAARVIPEFFDRAFLQHVWNSTAVRRQIEASARTTNGTFKVNQTMLESIAIIAPPLSLQHEFARRVAAVEKLKAAHRASLTEMNALFASLQHHAFRGEL